VKFTIEEIVQMSPNWAFVRTNSAGTNKINATGAVSAEGNQELFVFKKDDEGVWKIARYSFSPTSPPQP
jgi:ketosteroid isomerase-like protein